MRNVIRIYFVFIILVLINTNEIKAQLHDAGGIGSLSVSKELGRITELTLEQEMRFDRNFSSLNRSATSLGADFTIVRRMLRAELDYIFLYRRNDDMRYEVRHRFSAGFVGQYRYNRFILKLRTRGQATLRDGSRGDYKYNPKYVWRNRLELSYNIAKSPFRPYISGEIFCPINSDNGFFMDSYRLIVGTKYNITKRHSLDFMIRFDQDIQQASSTNILYGGVGWNYAF